eukprot:Gb_35075 [translate_table: standard]
MFDAGNRDNIDYVIARFFYACGISFNAARSPYYEEMVRAINNGPKGYKPSRYEKLRTTLIDKEKSRVEKQLEPVRDEWPKVGCSIIMDGWIDRRNRPLLNIMVSCLRGPYFMRAIDCSLKEKNAIFQLELLCEAIEEVGPSYVVQVITDATPVCKVAGLMAQNKYRNIYWTPCFVELLKPVDTRYGSYFILLHRLLEVQGALSAMVIGEMWTDWRQSSLDVASKVRATILDDRFWVDVKFVVDVIEPIINVICYGDTYSPCLGEVYETLDSMCEKV